jgi:hypothetical protein
LVCSQQLSIKKKINIPYITIFTMTIPPNDAFTLASHSESTPSLRSSRSRSLTRSPSPKIAFTSSQHPPNGESKRRPSRRQRKSNGFVSDSVKLADVDEALERALNGNGHGNGNGIAPRDKAMAPTAQTKKIDWEIPRKALHSSIGMSRDFDLTRSHLVARPPFFRQADSLFFRFCDTLSLRFSRLGGACCSCAFERYARHRPR